MGRWGGEGGFGVYAPHPPWSIPATRYRVGREGEGWRLQEREQREEERLGTNLPILSTVVREEQAVRHPPLQILGCRHTWVSVWDRWRLQTERQVDTWKWSVSTGQSTGLTVEGTACSKF